jgi:hypothetical protein
MFPVGSNAILVLHLSLADPHFRCSFISDYCLVVPDTLIDLSLSIVTLQPMTAHNAYRQQYSSAIF